MNDEIKDILNFLLYNDKLTTSGKRKLRDYITNLQQELEEYKDTETYSKRFLYKANKDRLNANLDLVKENERLKEENQELEELTDKYEEEHRNEFKLWRNGRQELADYKSRIEKAVEYIKKYRAMYFPSGCGDVIEYVPIEFKRDYYENGSTFTETENLLEILNGRSNE